MILFLWTCLIWMSFRLVMSCILFAADRYPLEIGPCTHGIAAKWCVVRVALIAWISFLLFGQ